MWIQPGPIPRRPCLAKPPRVSTRSGCDRLGILQCSIFVRVIVRFGEAGEASGRSRVRSCPGISLPWRSARRRLRERRRFGRLYVPWIHMVWWRLLSELTSLSKQVLLEEPPRVRPRRGMAAAGGGAAWGATSGRGLWSDAQRVLTPKVLHVAGLAAGSFGEQLSYRCDLPRGQMQ